MPRKLTVLGQELNVRISPTFIENAACPMCLKFTYVDKMPDHFSRNAALKGTAAHETIAELTRLCQKNDVQPQEIDDQVVISTLAAKSSHEILADLEEVLGWVILWRNRYQISPDMIGFEERMAVDENYETTSWDNGSWRGITDVIDIDNDNDHCTVTDYKSRANILSPSALKAALQSRFYPWLASKYYPKNQTFAFRIWYLRYGFHHETTYSLEDLAAFEQSLLLKERKIMDISDWNPVPGDHCGVCSHIHRCPIAQESSAIPSSIITQDQAEAAAGKIRVAESLIKTLKGKLKKYVEANDAVRLEGDFVYGFRKSTSKFYPPAAVEAILREAGRQLSEIGSVSLPAMKKFLKRIGNDDPALAERLREAAQETHKTTFKGYKMTEEDDTDENDDD